MNKLLDSSGVSSSRGGNSPFASLPLESWDFEVGLRHSLEMWPVLLQLWHFSLMNQHACAACVPPQRKHTMMDDLKLNVLCRLVVRWTSSFLVSYYVKWACFLAPSNPVAISTDRSKVRLSSSVSRRLQIYSCCRPHTNLSWRVSSNDAFLKLQRVANLRMSATKSAMLSDSFWCRQPNLYCSSITEDLGLKCFYSSASSVLRVSCSGFSKMFHRTSYES